MKQRLWFVVESGTDVRLVEGMAHHFTLEVLTRRIKGGVEINRPPTRAVSITGGPASRVRFAFWTFRHLLMNSRRGDRIVVQGYALAALAANLVGKVKRTKVTMLVCSPVERYYNCRTKGSAQGKPFRKWELRTLVLLAKINGFLGEHYVALSNHLKEEITRNNPKANVSVIPVYGVDTSIFHPATEDAAEVRSRRLLPSAGTLIFFSSRVAPEKDAETLLKAFSELIAEGRDLWLLHRSGGFRDLLEAAEAHGISERVIATDAAHPTTELPSDYQASQLCVQASREEGLGFSPLEALASGTPVVAAAVGGLRETIVDGETGWTYPAGDAAALAAAIREALDNPAAAEERTARGQKMVGDRFESSKVFEQFHKCISGSS